MRGVFKPRCRVAGSNQPLQQHYNITSRPPHNLHNRIQSIGSTASRNRDLFVLKPAKAGFEQHHLYSRHDPLLPPYLQPSFGRLQAQMSVSQCRR
jgi:hypothetical protein